VAAETDTLGTPLTEAEQALMVAYRGLRALVDRKDLAPSALYNAKEALASLWQAVNNLALIDERPPV
jgi:hypothetical protein